MKAQARLEKRTALTTAPLPTLQLKRNGSGERDESAAPPIVNVVMRSSGSPLDATTRAVMEPRFGHDFSRVRVHTDARSAESARAVGALAYTVGNHIAFDAGRYVPGTTSGMRLLAHELTHVVQQGRSGLAQVQGRATIQPADTAQERQAEQVAARVTAGESLSENTPMSSPRGGLQRQPAPAVDKSAKFIEDTYSWGARRWDDPRLYEAANDVRTCRENGGRSCDILLTDGDMWTLYGEYQLVEDVYGESVANTALREFKLHEVAEQAAKDKAKQGTSGVAIAGVALPNLLPGPAGPAAPPVRPPPFTVIPGGPNPTPPANPPLRVVPQPGTPAPGARPGPGISPGAAAGAAVVVFGIYVVVSLVQYAAFQHKAFSAGYKLLPSPRGVCMRGCHSYAPEHLPRTIDIPIEVQPLPRLGRPKDLEDIQRWIDQEPTPQPRPDPARKDRRKRKCPPPVPLPPRGGNVEHDALAAHVTGAPVEYFVITPEGLGKRFDGMDAIGTLYDVKTRHDWLTVLGLPDAPLTGRGAFRIAVAAAKLRIETQVEVDIARECGYEFRMATNNLEVVQHMRELLGDIIDPENIEYVAFEL